MSVESRYFSGDQSLQVLGSFMKSGPGSWSSVFCLCDENTHRHCYPALEHAGIKTDKVIVTGAGEKHKDLHMLSMVWGELLKGGADRHSLLLNLGGGMITDLGGMAASTFMRGIPFVNLPTTLLAMVDAAIGGKTGIDIHGGKNLAGTFASAEATIAHYPFLDTLPDVEWKNGMAEMIKHMLIADASGWDGMCDAILQSNDQQALREFFKNGIRESAAIKFRIVAEDPFEKGIRAALNFGHTIGHAFESWSLDSSHNVIPHGHAVAAGMICESYLASKISGLSQNDLTQIVSAIDHIFPRIRISREERGHVLEKIRLDKKRSSGKVRLALISAPGIPRIQVECEPELIAESLHFYSS